MYCFFARQLGDAEQVHKVRAQSHRSVGVVLEVGNEIAMLTPSILFMFIGRFVSGYCNTPME